MEPKRESTGTIRKTNERLGLGASFYNNFVVENIHGL